ncbi:MAG: phenylalanine--tRNA ligase subunit beta [Candidatus Doudnabacteria bacterium]
MKFSYSWLKELVEIKLSPKDLAEFLSLHAFEAEVQASTGKSGSEFPGIIVARVTKIDKHPNADRLRLVTLTDGRNIIAPVVCGAWNFEVGAIVALALSGAVIPHNQHDPEGKPFTLAKATIRGIESQGMICSAKELGLGSDGGGIMILDASYKLGEPFEVNDRGSEVIFDISVPANRPDIISYRGIAWEISALTNAKYKVKSKKIQLGALKGKVLKIRISEPALCKKYIGVRMVNVKIGPSPKFIQERLLLSGLRPINNVVDITNYVMLEVGQPMHAFDAGKVAGPITVRRAYLNETIKSLDQIDRKLTHDMLVIADSSKTLAIAGVIGGASSAVSDSTSEIILEAANFNGVSVRRTARTLGLRTDASARFEKTLPIGFTGIAASYAADLMIKYASAKPVEFVEAGVKKEKALEIKLDPEKVNTLLGTEIPAAKQKQILKKFGFTVTDHGSRITVSVPFWRPDSAIWEDLAEEIARFEGLEKIPNIHIAFPNSSFMTDPIVSQKDKAVDILVGLGFDEVYTYSFVSESDLPRWQIEKKNTIEVANPLSGDQQYLRPNLAINIIKLAERNTSENENVVGGKYFEIGTVFGRDAELIKEKTCLFMLIFPRSKKRIQELTGDLAELARRLNVEFQIKQNEEQIAEIIVAGKTVGRFGVFSSASNLEWIGINLDFEEFVKGRTHMQYRPINKFPTVELDTSILVKEDVSWAEIKKAIFELKNKLVSEVKLLEGSYQGKEITPGKKSVTFRIVYQAPERTLTKEEVNQVHEQILDRLKSKLQAQARD